MAGDHPSGMWSSAILYYFQVLFFGISDNCLLTVRTDRYNLDRNFQLFFQERDVSIELFGKFVFTLHFRHIDIPTRHFHIYGFDAFIDFKRKLCCFFAIDFISNASLYCFEAIQHIALHHDQFRHTVDHDRIFQRNQVNPATTAFAPSYSTIFMSDLTDLATCFIKQFCRKRTATDTCTISFEDTIHFTDVTRETPKPVQQPAQIVLEEVTNG